MEEQNDGQDILNLEENQDSENTENVESDELKKAQELANNYKIRAEKAEALAKQLKTQPVKMEESEAPKTSEEPLTLKDIRALQDVHDDDVDELTEYAKFKKISVAEAKKLPEMQALLSTKTEFRESQAATNTGGSKKGTSKNTHEAILERAEAGQLPEDDEGIKALSEARLAQRIANIKT